MAKDTLSLRLPETTLRQIEELTPLFGPSKSKAVERAIQYLYDSRLDVADADHKALVARQKVK